MPRKISTLFAIAHIVTCTAAVCAPNHPGTTVRKSQPEHAVRQDLEHRVERDEHGGELARAAGQRVPDEHHRDAAGEPDQHEAVAVRREIGEEEPRQREHDDRTDDPVEHERRADELGRRPRAGRSSRTSPWRAPGYIIASRPIAIGTDTPATCTLSSTAPSPGSARPSTRPSAIAAKIQTGRNRSSVESCLTTGAAATCPLPGSVPRSVTGWQQPQSGPQHASFAAGSARDAPPCPGLVPRTNALMNLPSIMRRHGGDVEAGAGEERRGVLRLVHAGRLDGRILESRPPSAAR